VIRYHFDLYPRTDPKNGALQVRFTGLQEAEYRSEANGTGSGRFAIRASHTDADVVLPGGSQYIRVVREDTVAVTEAVVGGFFLDQGDVTVLDDNTTHRLEFGGAGTLSVLDRAVMAPISYTGDEIQRVPDGNWAFAELFTVDTTLGAVLYRVMREALIGFRSPAVVADDREETVIGMVTLGFSRTQDSDGNAWTLSSGEFQAQVGEPVLQVVRRLMEAGLYVEMDPDTFELNAWQSASHGRDRTGLAWGTNVIRFTNPSDAVSNIGTVPNANILSQLVRGINAKLPTSHIWVGPQTDGGPYGDQRQVISVPRERFYAYESDDRDILEEIAEAQITALNEASDIVRLRYKLGTDPANGLYLPFETILNDDAVTVDTTGLAVWHFTDDTYPVAAQTIKLRAGGDWEAWVDLGSPYHNMSSRSFQARPVPDHTHPHNPRLCQPGVTATATVYEQYDWDSGQETIANPVATFGTQMLVQAQAVGPETGADGTTYCGSFGDIVATESNPIAVVAGTTYRIESKSQGFGHSWPTTDFGFVNWSIAAKWRDNTGTLLRTDIIASHANATQDGPFLVDAGGDFVAPTGATRLHFKQAEAGLGNENAATKWDSVVISTVDGGSTGDGHPDLVGSDLRAARCDHRHDVHRDRPPSVTDDGAAGYKLGTLWAQLDDLTNPTEIVAVWMLVDTTTGAAVWLELPTGTTGGGSSIWYNVVADFGATGDGVADDTAEIQAAIDAAEAAGGGVVYFPEGTYQVSSPLVVDSDNVTLLGDGTNASILRAAAGLAGSDVLQITSDHCHVRDLQVTSASQKTGGVGISFSTSSYCSVVRVRLNNQYDSIKISSGVVIRITDVDLRETKRNGIWITGTGNDYFIGKVVADNPTANATGSGILIDCTSNGATWVEHSDFIHFADGLKIAPASGQTEWHFITGCAFDNSTNDGIVLGGAGGSVYGVSFANSWAATNGRYGLNIASGTSGVNWNGGKVVTNGEHGINVSAGSRIAVEGALITSNGQDAANTYDGIRVAAGIQHLVVADNIASGGMDTPTTQRYGISFAAGATDYARVLGNDFSDNLSGAIDGLSGITGTDLVFPTSRYEVVMSGSAGSLAAVTNDAETDWIYGYVTQES
jgi:hypothetical protein